MENSEDNKQSKKYKNEEDECLQKRKAKFLNVRKDSKKLINGI